MQKSSSVHNSKMCETNSTVPHIVITEQPASRARFRYKSEGYYTGGIILGRTTKQPTIEIRNYNGPALIVVSCVTKDPPYRPHPHKLVGKRKNIHVVDGICLMQVPANYSSISFVDLGIQCCKKEEMKKSLEERRRQNVDPFKTGFDLSYVDLTSLRLCFQAFIESEPNVFKLPLKPVVSEPISDMKRAANLSISWLSHVSGSAEGGQRLCILCENVSKNDIKIVFKNPLNGWQAEAEFFPPEVHEHVSIVFLSPAYTAEEIDEPVKVELHLRKKSDPEACSIVEYIYIPKEVVQKDGLKLKRMRLAKSARSIVESEQMRENASEAGDRVEIDAQHIGTKAKKSIRVKRQLLADIDNTTNMLANQHHRLFNDRIPNILSEVMPLTPAPSPYPANFNEPQEAQCLTNNDLHNIYGYQSKNHNVPDVQQYRMNEQPMSVSNWTYPPTPTEYVNYDNVNPSNNSTNPQRAIPSNLNEFDPLHNKNKFLNVFFFFFFFFFFL